MIEEATAHTQGGIPPLSEVDRQVQEAIYKEAIEPALRKYLTDLREKAYIYIEPGFVDTGASPRETKSVFVGATLPPVKKKTAKARLDTSRPAPATTVATTTAAAPAAPATKSNSLAPVKLTAVGKAEEGQAREDPRYGQSAANSSPSAPELRPAANGADQGPGATSSLLPSPAPGAVMASPDQTASTSADEDPLAAAGATAKGKTRYSDRAPIEAKAKAAEKSSQGKTEGGGRSCPSHRGRQDGRQDLRNAPLQSYPTDTGKKKKKVKGAPKERIQEKAPAPPAPKPEANPIPPKSVRDNGEPAVTPSPNPSTLPLRDCAPRRGRK